VRAGDILIVYSLLEHPLRAAVKDHLYSFRRYASGRCVYLNLHARSVPGWIARARFDAVIFHTTLLSQRWRPDVFEGIVRKARPLKDVGGTRIALPQDEFIQTELLSGFINEFEVDHVFSVAPPSEWPKIYESVDRDRVRFSQVLTGYLSEETVRRIDRIVADTPERTTDVGYRAWEGAPWLGRHGMLKREVGEAFERAAAGRPVTTDISMRAEDVLSGDDWFRFLARCRYTVGVEGGATVLDRDGTLKARTEAYLAEHPGAPFEEVEAACFPGEDGKLQLFAISPRHLEACATRTCQVLVEGDYSGALRPGEHYLELRRDLSNVDDVLAQVEADSERERITENAYRDVVASGAYSYERFVREIEGAIPQPPALPGRSPGAVAGAWAGMADRASWLRVRLVANLIPRVSGAASRLLPQRAILLIRKWLYGTSTPPGGPPTGPA
jgi:hypothetical protein